MAFLDPRLPDRFWEKVMPEPNSGCWLWFAAHTTAGYGAIKIGGRKREAYRYAYETLVGAVPDGLELDHRCRVRSCCNPAHLDPVTHRTNILRGVGPIVENAAKTHCPAGHTYDDANTWSEKNGDRHCRECKRQRDRQYYADGRR